MFSNSMVSNDLLRKDPVYCEAIKRFELPSSKPFFRELHNNDLHLAAREGKIEAVEFLLAYYEVDCRNGFHATSLHLAAAYGQPEMVEYLLSKGADIEATNRDGNTPLIEAAKHGTNPNVLAVLLSHDANVNAEGISGKTAFYHLSRVGGQVQSLMMLQSRMANIQRNQHELQKLLMVAIDSRCAETVKFILNQGANIHAKLGLTGIPYICYAVSSSSVQVVEVLIEKGVDIQSIDRRGASPLHYACSKVDYAMVELLVKNKARVDVTDREGRTPLIIAILSNDNGSTTQLERCKIIRSLIKATKIEELPELHNPRDLVKNPIYRMASDKIEEFKAAHHWKMHQSQPHFTTMLRVASIGLYGTCRTPSISCGLPEDLLLKIAKQHLQNDKKAQWRFNHTAKNQAITGTDASGNKKRSLS